MRVMADRNIYISTLLFPASLPAKVLLHIVDKHELVLCDHIIMEIRDVVARKRPDLLADVEVFLAQLSYEMVITPEEPSKLISDPKDQPILNAAILAEVDIIVSGDKHFLQHNIERPKPMTVADFWQLEQNQ
jgi:putative PIN family toxin of toxin-antitoxin system